VRVVDVVLLLFVVVVPVLIVRRGNRGDGS
jgi:hypothetical protein